MKIPCEDFKMSKYSDNFVIDFIKLSVVHIVALFFILLNLMEYDFLFNTQITPFFILMVIFFWGIYHPTLFHPAYIFLIGVVYDTFFNLYLGLHAFIFLFLYLIVSRQRLFLLGQNYFIIYLLFILTAFGVYMLELAFHYMMTGAPQDYKASLYNLSFTILLFPIFNFFHVFLRKTLVQYGDRK